MNIHTLVPSKNSWRCAAEFADDHFTSGCRSDLHMQIQLLKDLLDKERREAHESLLAAGVSPVLD